MIAENRQLGCNHTDSSEPPGASVALSQSQHIGYDVLPPSVVMPLVTDEPVEFEK